jgi:dihydrodipicolinate synthase/N-acetylneuraminate lyase
VRALLAPVVAPDVESRIAQFVELLFRQPFLPAFKSMVADRLRDPEWLHMRAPLLALDAQQRRTLRAALAAAGFPTAIADAQQQ